MHVGGKNVRVHDNLIYNVNDDCMELESGNSENFYFYNNKMWDCFVGISMVPNIPGPLYIYRNTVVNNRLTRWETTPGSFNSGYCLKMGTGTQFKNAKLYNNSFYSHGTVLFDKNQAIWEDIEFVNNIMFSTYERTSDEINTSTGEGNIGRPNDAAWEHNLWVKTAYRDDRKAKRDDTNGIVGDPLYSNPLSAPPDLSVLENSPAIDNGCNIAQIKGWPDSVIPSDDMYDIGAVEMGGLDTTPQLSDLSVLRDTGTGALSAVDGVIPASATLFTNNTAGNTRGTVNLTPGSGQPFNKAMFADMSDNTFDYGADEPRFIVKCNAGEDVELNNQDWVYVSYYVRAIKKGAGYADSVTYKPLISRNAMYSAHYFIDGDQTDTVSTGQGWCKREYILKLTNTLGTANSGNARLQFIFANNNVKQYLEFADMNAIVFSGPIEYNSGLIKKTIQDLVNSDELIELKLFNKSVSGFSPER